MSEPNLSAFIWSVADLLRGDYKQSEYGKVILPFTVLRRLDCVLAPTKTAVLSPLSRHLGKPEELGALVTFLASEQAGYITGQSVVIDGGWMRGF